MPVHDWTRPGAWLFHDFHNTWLTHIKEALNGGLLPPGYFALLDQRAELYVPDIITLAAPGAGPAAGSAVAEPATDRKVVVQKIRRARAHRRVLVRTAREVVAVIEVVSPGNKDGPKSVAEFAGKVADLILGWVHVAVVDVLPPGRADPGGLHPEIWGRIDSVGAADLPPSDRPLTIASYWAGLPPIAYLNYTAVGQPLPDVPLCLHGDQYVNVPLEETYMIGYDRLPAELKAELG